MFSKMDKESITKVTYFVNSAILGMVLALMLFFYICHARIMFFFSFPTVCIYLVGYGLISRGFLNFYLKMIYFWITLYMLLATICLGYEYGFHLYCLSLIPIIHYSDYIAYRLKEKRIPSVVYSIGILLGYFTCILYVFRFGPVYEKNMQYASLFCISNSLFVFCFLVFYTRLLIVAIISSEEKLSEMGLVDQLTKLFNRHYMMEQLKKAKESDQAPAVALIDIDDFKQINDEYGHNAGDYVLKTLAGLMKETLPKRKVARWGGEEFLVLFEEAGRSREEMEQLCETVAGHIFSFEGAQISVTITIGLAGIDKARSLDEWIKVADEKLYQGKNTGKNRVIV